MGDRHHHGQHRPVNLQMRRKRPRRLRICVAHGDALPARKSNSLSTHKLPTASGAIKPDVAFRALSVFAPPAEASSNPTRLGYGRVTLPFRGGMERTESPRVILPARGG